MPNYSLSELAALMGSPIDREAAVSGVAIDSRLVKPGELFFALKGERVDGHAYIAEVASKGAVGAVVARSYAGNDAGLLLIRVPDVLDALQRTTKQILQQRKALIVAVTGSVGKTTTKDFIADLLSPKYLVAASPGNSNSQVGLPLAILNHTEGKEDVLVLEMGMTHPGQLAKLVQIAPPHIAVITTTTLVHACNFSGLEEIGRTKAEIFSHPDTQVGLLDRRIINFDELAHIGKCRKVSFAVDSEEADFSLSVEQNKMKIQTPDGMGILDLLTLPGVHNRHNFLAAVAVARVLGLTWDEIAHASRALRLPERRLQIVEREGVTFINDSYNANEVSLKAALSSLPEPKAGGKKIAVIGRMVDLGKFSVGCHKAVAEFALDRVDYLFCFGDESQPMQEVWNKADRPVVWAEERAAIVRKLREVLAPGDVVLLKGSRDKETWKVLDEL